MAAKSKFKVIIIDIYFFSKNNLEHYIKNKLICFTRENHVVKGKIR